MFFFPFADENPTNKKPIISWLIIFFCSSIFLNQIFEPVYIIEQTFLSFGMIPAILFGYSELSGPLKIIPPFLSIFTSMFLHGGWMHIIGNMTYLYIFGDNIEERLGKLKFIIFYLFTGIVAALTQAIIDPTSTIPMIGASGAIAGVLGGYLVLYPRAKIKVLFWFIIFIKVIKIRAFIVLGGWIIIQFISFNGADLNSGGVAYAAHIGGFISGIFLINLMKNKTTKKNKIIGGSVPNSK
ncbi:rhomboid family intramembrane serine protease [bacterium]|nr:rhomboid family intramembrane serine protease [bacterium]